MIVTKQIADLLTSTRGLIAFVIAYLGITQGAEALPFVVWLMILSWTTDGLDGPLARSSRSERHTWIGNHDLSIDILVSVGLLTYLLAAGFVSLEVVLLYLLPWGIVLWRWGLPRALGMLFQAPIYGLFLLIAMLEIPSTARWMLAWILAAIIITWPRFPREIVPNFLAGLQKVIAREDK